MPFHVLMTDNSSRSLFNFRAAVIRHIQKNGGTVTVLAPEDSFTGRLRDMGCNFIPLTMDNKGTSPSNDLNLLHDFCDTLRREKPNAVISYTIKNNIYGGIAARWTKVPFLPVVPGLGTAFVRKNWLTHLVTALYRYAFSPVPAVFFSNQDDLKIFVSRRIIRSDQVVLLPGEGIDLDHFPVTPLPRQDTVTFLLMARMIREKGIVEFVEATRQVKSAGHNIRCRLLGFVDQQDPSSIPALQIEAWVAEGLIEFPGSTDDVRSYVRDADCIVLPSFYREGMPRSLLEAASMGRPIITTDMPGCRDVVDDQKSGYLCKPQDVTSLAEAMKKIIALGHEGRQKMGEAARKKAEKEFSYDRVLVFYQDWLSKL